MAYFPDLSDYQYIQQLVRPDTVNVGWLAPGHRFETKRPQESFLDALWSYCRVAVGQTRGIHVCEFCADLSASLGERAGEKLLLGSSEIRVLSKTSRVYAAPALVYHYVLVHSYSPPEEFVRSVVESQGPDESFYSRLASTGIECSPTISRSELRPRRLGEK